MQVHGCQALGGGEAGEWVVMADGHWIVICHDDELWNLVLLWLHNLVTILKTTELFLKIVMLICTNCF